MAKQKQLTSGTVEEGQTDPLQKLYPLEESSTMQQQ